MKRTLSVVLAAIAILFMASCKKGGKTGLLIPKDAIVAFHVNTESLSSKLSWQEIKESAWFKKMTESETDEVARKLLADPESTGVDPKGGFTFFVKKQGYGGYAAFQGLIKSVSKFEAMLKNSGELYTIEKKDGLSYITFSHDAVLTWSSSRFIFVGDAPLGDLSPFGRGRNSSKSFSSDSLLNFAKATYKLKGKDLLDSDKKFADLIGGKGDVHFWFSAENYYGSVTGGMMSLLKANTLFEGNIATATLNFDNGKINISGHQYYGKEMAKLLEKYPRRDVSNELINRLPSGEVVGALVFNYSMEGLVEILKLSGFDGMANSELGREGLTLDDLAKALKGEFAFAVSGVERKVETIEYESFDGTKKTYAAPNTHMEFVFGVGIKDRPTFDKIYNVVKGPAKIDSTDKDLVIKIDNNWFVASNKETTATSFLAGGNKPAYLDKLSGHTFAGYLNFQALIPTFTKVYGGDSTKSPEALLALETFKDAIMVSDYEGSTASFNFDINLGDKNMNSLKQINGYFNKLSAISDEQNRKRLEEWNNAPATTDTAVAAPVAK